MKRTLSHRSPATRPHLSDPTQPGRFGRAGIACLAALWLTGCDSPEKQAVRDAEQAIAFYLPQLLGDPQLTNHPITVTGQGFSDPGWNVGGGHFVWGHRTIMAGSNTLSFRLYVMHPREFARSRDPGRIVTNDPAATGLTNVGALKLFATDRIFVAHAEMRAE